MKKKNKLPTVVFVVREKDGADSFLVVDDSVEHIEDGANVGVYQLTGVMTKRITHSLEEQ